MGKLPPGWTCPPVVALNLYPSGTCQVERASYKRSAPEKSGRGVLQHLSRKSLVRLGFVMAETTVKFRSILTLTWPKEFPNDGRKVKASLNVFLNWVRLRLESEYVWFLEFQKRGAPHFHILLESDNSRPLEMAYRWSGIVATDVETRRKVFDVHYHSSAWEMIRKPDGAKRYVMKYAMKPRQKEVPHDYQNVGRFWGASKGVKQAIPRPVTVEFSDAELRQLLDKTGHQTAEWDILPGTIFGIKFDNLKADS